jgi:hypothetical protein
VNKGENFQMNEVIPEFQKFDEEVVIPEVDLYVPSTSNIQHSSRAFDRVYSRERKRSLNFVDQDVSRLTEELRMKDELISQKNDKLIYK